LIVIAPTGLNGPRHGEIPQPAIALGQHDTAAAHAHCLGVALEDGCAGAARRKLQARLLDSQQCARAETHQVLSVGQLHRLIEIIDTPDEAALRVAPGTEVLDVQIADREHLRRIRELGAFSGPKLCPAVERRTQE